jgi:hypothetical protein
MKTRKWIGKIVDLLTKRDVAEMNTFVQSGGRKIYEDHSPAARRRVVSAKTKRQQTK